MPTHDVAQNTKDALAASWDIDHPTWGVTLHVDESWRPDPEGKTAMLLVADDGGVPVLGGPWMVHPRPDTEDPAGPSYRKDFRRITLRLTAFAAGRTEARLVVETASDEILRSKPRPTGIGRIDEVGDILLTRDPDTGLFLGSVLMPVVVRPRKPIPA